MAAYILSFSTMQQFSSNASGPLRQDVLRLYKRLLRLSQTWQAKDPNETTTERNYIQDETKRLFRENQNVQSPQRYMILSWK